MAGIAQDGWFYLEDHRMVTFLVDDRLFKVPKRMFVEGSELFCRTYGISAEGRNASARIELKDVKKDEFRSLLRALFKPSDYAIHGLQKEGAVALTTEEWISVLKLSSKWQFSEPRRTAIQNLTPHLNDGQTVRWLCLARQCEVGEWLLPSLHALARRGKAMQLEEVELLGVETVVKMAEVRESFRSCIGGTTLHWPQQRNQGDYSEAIKRLFGKELEQAGMSC